jgi:hypothetical protein
MSILAEGRRSHFLLTLKHGFNTIKLIRMRSGADMILIILFKQSFRQAGIAMNVGYLL